MKRIGNLWEQVISQDNLQLAFTKAAKGKKHRASVKLVEAHSGFYLEILRAALASGDYEVSRYRIKSIHVPKYRLIYALPFFPDRIVQHAVLNVLEPFWDARFISDSFACRKGKGQHKGMARCMGFVRRYGYVLKCDISKFYPNMDHGILKRIIRRKIKDAHLLSLLDKIIDSANSYSDIPGKNIPIGNTLSQWFGNLCLNELDTFVKYQLRIKGYARYCDDFVLFSDDKRELHELREKLRAWLWDNLRLRFSYAEIFPVSHGVDFLGYRQFPDCVLVRKRTAKRMIKNLRRAVGHGSYEYLRGFVASARGWMRWGQSWHLRQKCEGILRGRKFNDDEKVFGFLS